MWMAPDATVRTTSSFVSIPTTWMPRLAISAAVGRPIYPSPITATFWNSGIEKNFHDAFACPSIPKGIVRPRHRRVALVVVEQTECLLGNSGAVCTDRRAVAGFDRPPGARWSLASREPACQKLVPLPVRRRNRSVRDRRARADQQNRYIPVARSAPTRGWLARRAANTSCTFGFG